MTSGQVDLAKLNLAQPEPDMKFVTNGTCEKFLGSGKFFKNKLKNDRFYENCRIQAEFLVFVVTLYLRKKLLKFSTFCQKCRNLGSFWEKVKILRISQFFMSDLSGSRRPTPLLR